MQAIKMKTLNPTIIHKKMESYSSKGIKAKSRIPVPVNRLNKENENQERNKIIPTVQKRNKIVSNVQERNRIVSNVQSSNTKTINQHLLPTTRLKETSSQPTNVEKALNNKLKNNSKFKENKHTDLESNVKADDYKEKNRLLKTWLKPNSKKEKTNPSKDQLSSKSKVKSCDNKKEKLSTLKTAPNQTDEFSTPRAMLEEIKIPSKMDCFTAQKDIKFEANEAFREMILRGKEISPSVCNLKPGFRLSSIQSQRQSAYQKIEVSANPVKDTLEALQRFSLSVKKKGEQKSVMTGCQVFSSPLKDKSFFYTPHQDPVREVMKSLEKVKLKQLQKSVLKSTKKVTFDLNIKECSGTPKNLCDAELNSFKNLENRLAKICEKSEENTPNSPQNERIPASTLVQNKENSPTSGRKKNENFLIHPEMQINSETSDANKCKWDNSKSSTSCTMITKQLPTDLPKDINTEKLSSIQCKDPSDSNSVYDIQITDETSTKYLNVLRDKKLNAENIQNARTKVYTPRPVSLYSKSMLAYSSSPEFLEKEPSEALLKMAPICTPLVLKNMSKISVLSPEVDLSPVRLKLDFSEKLSPKKETPKNHKLVNIENIVTAKNILNNLADEECCLILSEAVPVLCGRYLANPVASILTEGDEMHFIPIQVLV